MVVAPPRPACSGCTIDRKVLGTLSQEEFLEKYYLQRPVLITNATSQWLGFHSELEQLKWLDQVTWKAVTSVHSANLGGELAQLGCSGIKSMSVQLGDFMQRQMQLPQPPP